MLGSGEAVPAEVASSSSESNIDDLPTQLNPKWLCELKRDGVFSMLSICGGLAYRGPTPLSFHLLAILELDACPNP